MIVKLNDQWHISTQDSQNVVLEKIMTNKETGEPYTKGVSYHGTLRGALSSALDDSKIIVDRKTKKEHMAWSNRIEEVANSLK